MKLFSLTGNPSKPCLLLTYKGVTLMLDCGLDQSSLLQFLPHHNKQYSAWKPGKYEIIPGLFKQNQGHVFLDAIPEFIIPELNLVDMKQVDAILISNSVNMLALPFITELTQFQGRVYVTEPALQVGRMYMEELVNHVNLIPDKHHSTATLNNEDVLCQLPNTLQNAIRHKSWRRLYTRHEVNTCLSRVDHVGFNEKIDVLGTLTVSPSSSGHSLGSCNWTVQSTVDKIVYLSASATIATHPKPMDLPPLKNADFLILSNLTSVPTYSPDVMMRDFCVNVTLAIRNGGNVLVPCNPSGITLDLFECLASHLDSCGVNVPLYFISTQADSSLAFSNIFAEWLNPARQNRVYLPEAPFPHADLQKSGRLLSYSSVNAGLSQDYRQPCVVFTGHPSLRFGDVTHFMQLWGKSNSNLIIFTDPEFNYLESLLPYQPLNMSVHYCPIDTAFNFAQINTLIPELSPQCVVTPECYIQADGRPDLSLEISAHTLTYTQHSVLKLPSRKSFGEVEMTPALADSLITSEVRRGVYWSPVNAYMSVKDGRSILDKSESKRQTRFVWGQTDIDNFKRQLHKQGLSSVTVDETTSGYFVHLPDDDSLIRIEGNDTHVIANQESTRAKIRDALLQCLSTL